MRRIYYHNSTGEFGVERGYGCLVEPDEDLKEKLEQLRAGDLEPGLYNGYFKVKDEALKRLGVENESERDSRGRD
jgi:hypothetical protein